MKFMKPESQSSNLLEDVWLQVYKPPLPWDLTPPHLHHPSTSSRLPSTQLSSLDFLIVDTLCIVSAILGCNTNPYLPSLLSSFLSFRSHWLFVIIEQFVASPRYSPGPIRSFPSLLSVSIHTFSQTFTLSSKSFDNDFEVDDNVAFCQRIPRVQIRPSCRILSSPVFRSISLQTPQ